MTIENSSNKSRFYVGTGCTTTPPHVLEFMKKVATFLEKKNFILRSGSSENPDIMFEKGIYRNRKEIYLPWVGFDKRTSDNKTVFDTIPEEAFKIAELHHNSWSTLKRGPRNLMGRNVMQVLGNDLKTPSEFVICWTKDANHKKPENKNLYSIVEHIVSIANDYKVPVFNLKNPTHFNFIKKLIDDDITL